MRITRRTAQQLMEVLGDLGEKIRNEEKPSYPYAEWERERKIVKERLRKLPEYVEKAASMLAAQKDTGRPKNGTLVQRTMLFLFARLMNKSNRDVEEMLELFEPLFGITVSYKTIERLYSDEEVQAVIHNLFILLLKDDEVSGHAAGDGTGYTLTVSKHYRSAPKKRCKDYRYAFRFIDIDTGLYIGVGYSPVSEMGAFQKAVEMVDELGIPLHTVRLDKYYSSRKVLDLFGNDTTVYVMLKKNLSRIGLQWLNVIRKIMESPYLYLKDYLRRNLSEAGYSSDKSRFGGVIRQKRDDRRETALFSVALFHNMFFTRVVP
jgi:transposase